MRARLLIAGSLAASLAQAQYPFTRSFDLRLGQLRPHVGAIAMDPDGMLWCATDAGLVRTDGSRHLVVLPGDGVVFTAVAAGGGAVYAATNDGTVVRCRGLSVDTVLVDTGFRASPVRSLCVAADGALWLGTYGDGIRMLHNGDVRSVGTVHGLSDVHVNALVTVPGRGVAVASDQGIDLFAADGRKVRTVDQSSGAPDNLVLSLAVDERRIYAGTDRAGVFTIANRGLGAVDVLDPGWAFGAVRSLAADPEAVWAGTDGNGMVVRSLEHGSYAPPDEFALQRVSGSVRGGNGLVWWCDGTDRIHRADPQALVVPQHEGIDFRRITALDVDRAGRIVFAIGKTVYGHSTAFSAQQRLSSINLPLGVHAQIASVHVDRWGRTWVGTMGDGVVRIDGSGAFKRYTIADGLVNDHVLSVRSHGGSVWFATLSGIGRWNADDSTGRTGRFEGMNAPGHGFIYDVLPVGDDKAFAATDGNGLLFFAQGEAGIVKGSGEGSRSYYSLAADGRGGVWAVGPRTGFAHVDAAGTFTRGAPSPAFEDEVFGITMAARHVIMMGASGMAALDPRTGAIADISDVFGLRGASAPLNGMRTAADGAVWLVSDHGLVRLKPAPAALTGTVPAVITDLRWGDRPLSMDSGLVLDAEQNFLDFGMAAPSSLSPELLLFQYQLEGFDHTVITTLDREVGYARLHPGPYRFKVRAVSRGSEPEGEWTEFAFRIAAPWYRTTWATAGFTIGALAIVVLLIRARDERLRFKERMEKEKVRFQLEAVRSQVNPHFLFNSFNTLIELIEEDRDKAVGHVQQLSDFFRNILQVREKELIPLNEELVLLDNYWALEKRRFGPRIGLELQVPDDQLYLLLPPLTLQLLVENAIKHNAATDTVPLIVSVHAEAGVISVTNTIRPRSTASRSTGFGLQSIRQRFAALTDRPMEVLNDGATFVVRIPLIAPEA